MSLPVGTSTEDAVSLPIRLPTRLFRETVNVSQVPLNPTSVQTAAPATQNFPPRREVVPGGHRVGETVPAEGQALPSGHGEQEGLPGEAAKVPGEHGVQLPLPRAE
jgi:hypothetical protein